MRQLEKALTELADRGERLSPEVLLARIGTQLSWSDGPSLVADPEETVMITDKPIEQQAPTAPTAPKPRWRPAVMLSAAALVVLIGIGVAWIAGAFEPAPDAASPERAAVNEIMGAFNRGDAATYASYFEEGVVDLGGLVVRSEEFTAMVGRDAARGARIEWTDCSQRESAVTCTFTAADDDLGARTGVRLVWDATYYFNDDGMVEDVFHDGDDTYKEKDAFARAFGIWLESAYPDVYPTFYVPGFYTPMEIFWEPGMPVIGPYIDEFVAQSDVYPLR